MGLLRDADIFGKQDKRVGTAQTPLSPMHGPSFGIFGIGMKP
jgi:hypothetical protein